MADFHLHELMEGSWPESLGRDVKGMRWKPARQGDTPGQLIPGEGDLPEPIDARPRRRWFR